MGIFGSSEENVEIKTVDSNGQVNNNIVIQEAKDMHTQMMSSGKLVLGTYILIGLEVVKITICLFGAYRRYMKKRYQSNEK